MVIASSSFFRSHETRCFCMPNPPKLRGQEVEEDESSLEGDQHFQGLFCEEKEATKENPNWLLSFLLKTTPQSALMPAEKLLWSCGGGMSTFQIYFSFRPDLLRRNKIGGKNGTLFFPSFSLRDTGYMCSCNDRPFRGIYVCLPRSA
jgi:hypothetical protein